MNDKDHKPGAKEKQGRDKRLAKALRDNLRRRKSQMRKRSGKEAAPGIKD